MNLLNTITEEALKRFDEVSKDGDWCGCYEGDLDGKFPKQQSKVKNFIHEEVKVALETVRGQVEKMFIPILDGEPNSYSTDLHIDNPVAWMAGYHSSEGAWKRGANQALDQVLSLLDTQEKEKKV